MLNTSTFYISIVNPKTLFKLLISPLVMIFCFYIYKKVICYVYGTTGTLFKLLEINFYVVPLETSKIVNKFFKNVV